jgi:hypothetical protein
MPPPVVSPNVPAATADVWSGQPEMRFTPDDRREHLLVVGLEVELRPADLASFADITIYGQTVRIPPQLLKSGPDHARLRIVARSIVFAPGATLDYSGRFGRPPLQTSAASGKPDGGKGEDGAAGEDGIDGGRIELWAEQVQGTPGAHRQRRHRRAWPKRWSRGQGQDRFAGAQ